jgi:integrase/recombinase XerC
MGLRVAGDGDVFLLAGDVATGQRDDVAMVNRFLAHLKGRNFARATRRAYAFDVLNFLRFLDGQGVGLGEVRPTDLFDYLDWQTQPKRTAGSTVVRLFERRGAAPATQNRRIAAVRGLFEFAVITGVVMTSPVPAPRRTSGLRARRGLLGHIPARHRSPGGRLVREQRLLPESLELAEIEAFLTDLGTHRDRAMVLLMLLGGLRAAEVRGLLLAG